MDPTSPLFKRIIVHCYLEAAYYGNIKPLFVALYFPMKPPITILLILIKHCHIFSHIAWVLWRWLNNRPQLCLSLIFSHLHKTSAIWLNMWLLSYQNNYYIVIWKRLTIEIWSCCLRPYISIAYYCPGYISEGNIIVILIRQQPHI